VSESIEEIMAHARVDKRSDGTFFACVPCIAHAAFSPGRAKTALEALSSLRGHLGANMVPVARAWRILGPRKTDEPRSSEAAKAEAERSRRDVPVREVAR